MMRTYWIHLACLTIICYSIRCQSSRNDDEENDIWKTTTTTTLESITNGTAAENSTELASSTTDLLPTSLRGQFLCFSCTASSLGEDQPNANCTENLDGFVQAVMRGVDVIPCETKQCYTDVIRLGDYLSVFRGCRQQNEDLISYKTHAYDSYNCTRLTLLGKAVWWSCACDGSLCNNPLPPV